MSAVLLVLSSFLASAVEMVEALTIVLAAGLTRGWRSSLTGVAAAVLALAVVVAALGPALTLVPLNALRLVVGALLLVFGLQWLRKAILRASGYKALHDEDAIFARELREAESAPQDERIGVDWYGFTLSFKGVFLEGLEVAFIVLTFGSTQGSIPLAAAGAFVAIILVAARRRARPCTTRPRAGEHDEVRRRDHADDLRDLLVGGGGRRGLARRRRGDPRCARLRDPLVVAARLAPQTAACPVGDRLSVVASFGRFWWEFIVGDDWLAAAGVAIALVVTAVLETWWILPLAVAFVLAASLYRATRHS